jgi:hypothetical protein
VVAVVEDSGDALYAAIAVGFALALVIVVLALFQDVVAAIGRAGWRGASAAAAPILRGVGRRTAQPPRSFSFVGLRLAFARATAGIWSFPGRLVTLGYRPALAPMDDEEPTEATAPSDDVVLPLEPRTAPLVDDAADNTVSRRRIYRPASAVRVESSVREFLNHRGGTATIDHLVRHLDREFGDGLGMGLIETMRRRGAVTLRRNKDRPTRLDVTLVHKAALDH